MFKGFFLKFGKYITDYLQNIFLNFQNPIISILFGKTIYRNIVILTWSVVISLNNLSRTFKASVLARKKCSNNLCLPSMYIDHLNLFSFIFQTFCKLECYSRKSSKTSRVFTM